MTILIIGVALWWGTHLFPMLATGARGTLILRMGKGPYKGAFAAVSFLAVVLMIIGYRGAEYSEVYLPPTWGVHLNNLLMLLAIFLLGAKDSKGRAKEVVRHPMLWSVVIWAVAHLLMRGDLAAVVLFGGLAVWAIVAMVASNMRDGEWARPSGGTATGDVRHLVITVVVYAVIMLIHWQIFGLRPFP